MKIDNRIVKMVKRLSTVKKIPKWFRIISLITFLVSIAAYLYFFFYGSNEVWLWISTTMVFASGWATFLIRAHDLKEKNPRVSEIIKTFVFVTMIIVGTALVLKLLGQY